jgi:flagellar motor protein MotB
MTEETSNLLETVPPTEEQAHTLAPDSTESSTEQTAESTEKPQEAPKPKTDWAQRRIDQLTREKYEERRQSESLAQQLAQYQQPTEQQSPSAPDIDKLVEQRLAEKSFNEACNRVFQEGVKADPKFEQNLRTLQSVGEVSKDFLEVVTDMDEGHKVLNYLGANPDEADAILSLPPLKQARALAKLEASISKPASAPPVSKAPPPISPVGSKAAPVVPDSFATTADYIAWRKQNR